MTGKARRHSLIRSLVPSTPIESQEQLQQLLAQNGVRATQGTISRDLREIGVVKGPRGYMLQDAPPSDNGLEARIDRAVLQAFVTAIDTAGNLVIAKTGPGRAPVVAVELDRGPLDGIVGTLAGDDTIFLAARTSRAADRIAAQLRQIAGLA